MIFLVSKSSQLKQLSYPIHQSCRQIVFNSQLEDRVCCKNISEKCGLPFKTVEFEPFYKMCEDSVYYERMGELAFIYGGNKTYQQLMENGNGSDYMTFGFLGEPLRSNDALDKVYHTPFPME